MTHRRGWTLVEMVFVVALLGFVTVIAFQSFFQGQRETSRLDFRLQALQSAYLVRAHLADDLASHLPAPPGQPEVPCASAISMRRVRQEDECGIAGTCLDEHLQPIADVITYEFDPVRHVVCRNGHVLGSTGFLDVTFSYFPYKEGVRGETLEVHMVVVPEQSLANPDRSEFPDQEIVSFSFHCPQTTIERAYSDFAVDR